MSNITKGLAVIAVILAVGVGLVVWKTKVGGHGGESLNHLSKEEMTLLLADANPMQLQQLASAPEAKKKNRRKHQAAFSGRQPGAQRRFGK